MEGKSLTIPIYMHGLLTAEKRAVICSFPDSDPFADMKDCSFYFGPSGRWLLAALLEQLNLSRSNEIAIITTSDAQYVTTCVSVTAFNYCKISRVVTEDTKVIIAIHEFGYIIPGFEEKIKQWKQKGLVIIEDCAHLIGLDINDRKVGSFGDYALFSLPKILPSPYGGLILSRLRLKLPPLTSTEDQQTKQGIMNAELFLSKHRYFSDKRLLHAETLVGLPGLYQPSQLGIPYFLGIQSIHKEIISRRLPSVEWGATLRSDLLYIPTNPLADDIQFKFLAEEIQEIYEDCITG